ncbi:MAG: DUF177 domain-containing protein [Pigmentiphaga sp.]
MDLTRFDALEAVRLGQRQQGQVALTEFSRLLQDLPESQSGVVQWVAQGERGPLGQAWLRLSVAAPLQVVCQRCLRAFSLPVESEIVLELVASEDELDAEDPDDAANEPAANAPLVEKVLCRGRLDLQEQIEDELILSVPYITRHGVCPQPLPAGDSPQAGQAEAAEGKRQPFAVLEGLKPSLRRSSNDDDATD